MAISVTGTVGFGAAGARNRLFDGARLCRDNHDGLQGEKGRSRQKDSPPRGRRAANPSAAFGLSLGMDSWIGFAVVVVVWTLLQVWLLPRLGVPT